MLSHQLPVIGLVSHYLTNYLIGHRPFIERFLAKPLLVTDFSPQEITLRSKVKGQKSKFWYSPLAKFSPALRDYRHFDFCIFNFELVLVIKNQSPDHLGLSHLSMGYTKLYGTYQCVPLPFATIPHFLISRLK